MTAVNICAGFKTTGIYPLNADILKIPGQVEAQIKIFDSSEVQRLPFAPAKRQVFHEEDLPDSPLTSISDYQPAQRQGIVDMANIENIPLVNSKPSHLNGTLIQRTLFLHLNKVWIWQ